MKHKPTPLTRRDLATPHPHRLQSAPICTRELYIENHIPFRSPMSPPLSPLAYTTLTNIDKTHPYTSSREVSVAPLHHPQCPSLALSGDGYPTIGRHPLAAAAEWGRRGAAVCSRNGCHQSVHLQLGTRCSALSIYIRAMGGKQGANGRCWVR